MDDFSDDFSRFRPLRPDRATAAGPRPRARALRRLTVLGEGRWHAPIGQRAAARVLAVCGPTGVGKSTMAANLAIAMAGLRSRVVLVDLDLRRPIQHRLFGVASPVGGLHALLEGEIDTIEQALTPTSVRNLFLVTADAARPPGRPRPEQQRHLLKQIWELDADVIIADVSADEDEPLVDLFEPGALRLVVSAPDARSIRSAYNFLRTQVARTIEDAAGDTAEGVAMVAALGNPSAPPMGQLLAHLGSQGKPETHAAVIRALAAFGGRLIGNRAHRADEADFLHATSRLVADYLGVATPVLGIVEASEHLTATASSGRPLLLGTGIDRNVRLFHAMAEQLLVEATATETEGDSEASDAGRAGLARDPGEEGLGARASDLVIGGDAGAAGPIGDDGEGPPLPAPLGAYMRRFPRHPVDWHARYVSRSGRDVDVRVFDVSQTGASIEAIAGFDLGDGGRLTFTQIEGQPTVDVTVKDAHRPMGRVGLRFDGSPEITTRLAAIARRAREDEAPPQVTAAH